ncbi:MAG TPA: ATP-binding protein [Acidimicrobiia bacterium]|nr:ATP-binding protein [Acidimicrobiia bacterium]
MTRRLLLSYLALTLFVLVVLEVPLGVIFARRQLSELTTGVERDAVAVASLVEDALEGGTAVDAGGLLPRYAHDTRARVVVVDARGVAVADSAGTGAGTSFANRPEIATALAGRVATGTRHSATVGADLLYVAVPVASGGVVHGAVRITYPTSTVDARVRRSWLTLTAVSAVCLLAAAGLAVGFTRSVSRPLGALQRAATSVGRGQLSARAPTDDGPPEIRTLARAFNDSAARLSDLLAAQDAFVADASHQLRSPLTALRLRLENLEAEVPAGTRADVRAATAEARRLSRTVDGLLALARADRAAGTPPAEVVDPAAVLEERRAAWSALAEERGVDLVVEVTDGSAAGPVRATTDRLVQVIDNLLANALDAAPPGTAVVLRTARDPARRWVEVHVLDRGPGLSDADRARAFDRFWRGAGPNPAGRDLGGSGLGLSIVRRLVTADGGQVDLAARPDGGTDAIVRLTPATGA